MLGSRQKHEATWGFISRKCRCGDCQITQTVVVVVGVWLLERRRHLGLLWYQLPGWPLTCFNRKTTGWGTRIDFGGAGYVFGLLSSTPAVLSYTSLWWGFNWWVRSPGHVVLMSWHYCALALSLPSISLFFPLLKHNYLIILPKQTASHWTAHSKP